MRQLTVLDSGRLLASVSRGLRHWIVATAMIPGLSAAWMPATAVAMQKDESVRTRRVSVPRKNMILLSFSPDGRRAISSDAFIDTNIPNREMNASILIWDVEKGKLLRRFEVPEYRPARVAWSPDGSRVMFVGDGWSKITVLDETGEELHFLNGHRAQIYDIAFLPDGQRALSTSKDGTMRLWDLATGKELGRFPLKGEKSHVSVVVSPDGRQAIAYGSVLQLWDLEKGNVVKEHQFAGPVTRATFSAKGDLVLVCFKVAAGVTRDFVEDQVTGRVRIYDEKQKTESALVVWNAQSGQIARAFEFGPTVMGHPGSVTCVALSRDAHRAVSGSDNGTLIFWNTETGKELDRVSPKKLRLSRILEVRFAPDDGQAVFGDLDGTFGHWELPR